MSYSVNVSYLPMPAVLPPKINIATVHIYPGRVREGSDKNMRDLRLRLCYVRYVPPSAYRS